MSFQISTRYKQTAQLANRIPIDKFPLLINRIFQKLHLKNARLFSEDEEEQLRGLFSFSSEELKAVIDCCCYTFEQAAYTSTGPEPLYETLLSAGFTDGHAKIIGRTWAAEAAEYVNKLKDQTLGYRYLSNIDYHINMVVGQSELTRQQEPCALFELSITNPVGTFTPSTGTNVEKLKMEFNHAELYSFFNELERMQQQLDKLSKS